MFLEAFLNLIYPHQGICLNCGNQAEEELCDYCSGKVDLVLGYTCSQCGVSLDKLNRKDAICYECSQYVEIFNQICAVGYYDNTLKKMILDYKYHRKTYLAKLFANMLADRISHTMWTDDIDYIVPVPLSVKRRSSRGFNQMDLIGKELSKLLSIKFISDGLVRIKNTKPLKTLERQERADSIDGAFIIGNKNILGSHILLIDDVFTTGSTLRECAKTLLDFGALCVSVAVIARA